MRRVLFCFVAMFLFSACSAQVAYVDPSCLSPSFSCEAFVRKESEEWVVHLSRNGEGGFSVFFDDHAFLWSGGKYCEQYAGLKMEYSSCVLPRNALPNILRSLFEEVYSENVVSADEVTLQGTYGQFPFSAEVDPDMKRLKRIVCDGLGLEIVMNYV